MTRYLIIPGWSNSGPAHWQSHWERELDGVARVEMSDWLEPRRRDWVTTLDLAVRNGGEAPILIAHSLGCIAIAHWAATHDAPIRGALLVAPADVERAHAPEHLRDFAPIPRLPLRFPSRVVASDNDPYATLGWARQISDVWGSELTVLEGAGHINTQSGFGPWREGYSLLPVAPTIAGRGQKTVTSSVDFSIARAARR
jgi:predicted alpha/beta hydrolase family esterase